MPRVYEATRQSWPEKDVISYCYRCAYLAIRVHHSRALWPLRRTSICRKVNASERLTEPTLTTPNKFNPNPIPDRTQGAQVTTHTVNYLTRIDRTIQSTQCKTTIEVTIEVK